MAQTVKNPPAMQETWVLSLSLEDPLKKEMATHSSILAWEISWTEKPGRLQSMGSQKRHNLATEEQQVLVGTENLIFNKFEDDDNSQEPGL